MDRCLRFDELGVVVPGGEVREAVSAGFVEAGENVGGVRGEGSAGGEVGRVVDGGGDVEQLCAELEGKGAVGPAYDASVGLLRLAERRASALRSKGSTTREAQLTTWPCSSVLHFQRIMFSSGSVGLAAPAS